jgi:hypothetical protein
MAALRVLIALTVLLAFLAGRHNTTVSHADELTVEIQERVSPPRFDIYGNQVDPAVGDYRVDPLGGLYERHAPDTAVLKLGPAST